MRRWNGWGDEATEVELPAHGEAFLAELVGPGQRLADASLQEVLARVPASRLAPHPLICQDAEVRVRHARGQSLPDWLAMRSGEFGLFPDGVACPESAEQIRDLLAWAQQHDVTLIGRIEQLFAGGKLEAFAGTLDIPTFPASAAGPDLRELVLGSEGRFGVISEVRVRISRLAEQERFYAVFLPSWQQALSAIRSLAQARVPLSMLRLSNAIETRTQLALAGHPQQIALLEKYLALRGARDGKCMLTFGVTGNRLQNAASLKQARRLLKGFGGVFTGTLLGKKWEHNRFRFPYLRHGLWERGYLVDTLETATDWSNVDNLLNKVEASLRDELAGDGERVHVFTHLSHVYGEGSSIYTTYVFRPGADYAEAMARWQRLKAAASRTIAENRGTISHQHGVGRDHAPYLAAEKGELGMATLRSLATHFDPDQRLAPGVLLQD
ncbi:MAG: hypothetical protein CVV08_00780 [Gammaproteobacteria bacterium HGW-Gammaproteobacteria-12]|nr:MAG: hypothetical protein CVV08_00780 [Gammaproteobacteria bacterium HGW-Gammaproteobacteria-12]